MGKDTAFEETATAVRVGLARRNSPQSALAEHLKLSQPAIHRRMTGKVPWRIDELGEVARFLGVAVTDLLPAERTDVSA